MSQQPQPQPRPQSPQQTQTLTTATVTATAAAAGAGKKKKQETPKPVTPPESDEVRYARREKEMRGRIAELTETTNSLTAQLLAQEQDAMEVITALKKESQLQSENEQRKEELVEAKIAAINEAHANQLEALEAELAKNQLLIAEKEENAKNLQADLVMVQEFKKKKFEIQKSLDSQRNEIVGMEMKHKEAFARMERKFFEEKLRMQREANAKIADLALKAHKEAVLNLDETTKSTFQENVRLTNSLNFHYRQVETLRADVSRLTAANKILMDDKDFNSILIKQKIMQSRTQDTQVRTLQSRLSTTENSLTHVVREFNVEQEMLSEKVRKELDDVAQETAKLRSQLERKNKESLYIKKLAQWVLKQRSETETFFLDALAQCRAEMKARTPVANCVALSEHSRFEQLSWDDREKVLRVLFAKINGIA